MNKNIENFVATLTKKGIKPSQHRIKILEYLTTKRNHPTVDKIFNDLIREIPTLSKATVYNALDLFKEAKLARVITIEDNETRYDTKVLNHGHFKCESCGTIFDFEISIDDLSTDSLKHFKINEKNVYFRGICPGCLEKD